MISEQPLGGRMTPDVIVWPYLWFHCKICVAALPFKPKHLLGGIHLVLCFL